MTVRAARNVVSRWVLMTPRLCYERAQERAAIASGLPGARTGPIWVAAAVVLQSWYSTADGPAQDAESAQTASALGVCLLPFCALSRRSVKANREEEVKPWIGAAFGYALCFA